MNIVQYFIFAKLNNWIGYLDILSDNELAN